MTLGEKLARWMKESGSGQAAVAAHTGMAQATISGLVTGKTKRPTPRMILGVHRAMECDLEWLIDEEAGWPMRSAKPAEGGPALTPEQREILVQAELIDKYFGPGAAMRRLMGGDFASPSAPDRKVKAG